MSNKHSATKVESHGLLHDQKIRRIAGDVFAHLFLAIGRHLARPNRMGVRGVVQ